ncbi:MAG: hypothetical protein AAFO07_02415, partial [Bacteroidota bacterium]
LLAFNTAIDFQINNTKSITTDDAKASNRFSIWNNTSKLDFYFKKVANMKTTIKFMTNSFLGQNYSGNTFQNYLLNLYTSFNISEDWFISLEINNLLNRPTFNNILYSGYFTQEQQYFLLPRFLLVSVAKEFK